MRLDLFARYRLEHGQRIQQDRGGQGAIAVGIATRLGWASGDWIGVLNDMVRQFSGPQGNLRAWGVIKAPLRAPELFTTAPDAASPAVDPLLAAQAPARVDEFLLQTLETMSRTFCGLITRGLCLWQGGVYNMVKLLSEDLSIQSEAIRRAQLLFPRILALEKLLASTGCPKGVRAFANRFIWFDGVVYRELLCLLSEGHIEFAKTYARRVHGTVHHEKGIEDIFKSLRRLTDKGAENEVINLDRMYLMSCMAAPACFPSVAQEEITQADWEGCRGQGGLDEFRGILPRWNRTRTGLASGCYRPMERATEIPKPIAGQKTCTSAAHSQQVALEECLLDCSLLPDGSFETMTAMTHSWVSGLVFTVQQTAVGVLEPTILVHEASGCAYLIVLSLGRCVYGWPLRVQGALLVMAHPIRALVPIVLTSPHLGPATPIQAVAFAIDFVFVISRCREHNWQTENPLIAPQCFVKVWRRPVSGFAGSRCLRHFGRPGFADELRRLVPIRSFWFQTGESEWDLIGHAGASCSWRSDVRKWNIEIRDPRSTNGTFSHKACLPTTAAWSSCL
jgi:hypothetical protein